MTRERYKTPDTDVLAEFDRVCELFQKALPGPADRLVFECLMNEASNLGLNWVDALQYVVDRRSRLQSISDVQHSQYTQSFDDIQSFADTPVPPQVAQGSEPAAIAGDDGEKRSDPDKKNLT